MQIWVLLLVVVFGGMELMQWVSGLALPMPIFIAAGVLLAIASNTDKQAGLPWRSSPALKAKPTSTPAGTPPPLSTPPAAPDLQPPSQSRSPELPTFTRNASAPQKPISFTVRKPTQSGE